MPPPCRGGGEDGCGPTDFTVFTVMFTVPVVTVTREATRARSVLSLVFCDTVVRSHLGGFKNAILSITFFSYVQKCDTVDLESGHVFTIFHICDTVVLDSHLPLYYCCTDFHCLRQPPPPPGKENFRPGVRKVA